MDVPHLADLAGQHAGPGLVDEREEAQVEVRAVDEAARLGELEQLGRLLRRHRERLLADDVLPRREHLLGLRMVEVVRRRQVDDVDRVVGEQRLERVVDGRDRLCGRALGRGADDARDVDAEEAQRVHVHDADETGADDARPELGQVAHAAIMSCRVRAVRQSSARGVTDAAVDRQAPVDEELLTRHVAGGVGDEEQRCVGDLGRLADAAERDALLVRATHLGGVRGAVHRRLGRTGCDAR